MLYLYLELDAVGTTCAIVQCWTVRLKPSCVMLTFNCQNYKIIFRQELKCTWFGVNALYSLVALLHNQADVSHIWHWEPIDGVPSRSTGSKGVKCARCGAFLLIKIKNSLEYQPYWRSLCDVPFYEGKRFSIWGVLDVDFVFFPLVCMSTSALQCMWWWNFPPKMWDNATTCLSYDCICDQIHLQIIIF